MKSRSPLILWGRKDKPVRRYRRFRVLTAIREASKSRSQANRDSEFLFHSSTSVRIVTIEGCLDSAVHVAISVTFVIPLPRIVQRGSD